MAQHSRRAGRERNRAPVLDLLKPGGRGQPESRASVLSRQNQLLNVDTAPEIRPGLFGISFGDVFGGIGDFIADAVDVVTDFIPGLGSIGDFGAELIRGGTDLVTGGGGGGRRPPPGSQSDPRRFQPPVSRLDTFTGRDGVLGDFNFLDEADEILRDLGLPTFGPKPQQVAITGEDSRFGGPVSGFFTDLDANQLQDAAGRPLVVNPGLEERIKCPRGYVAVEIDEEGTRVCMLKGAAISQGLYSRRPRPPISASEWRILKSSGRTAKKVEVVLGKAGAAVGKKLISKSARTSRPRARPALSAGHAQLLLNAGQPRSDDDSVIINT